MTDEYQLPTVRILCKDGVFTEEATHEIRVQYAGLRDCPPERKKPTPWIPNPGHRQGHEPIRAAKERLLQRKAAKATPVKPQQRAPKGTDGHAWNHRPDVTIEAILGLQQCGLTGVLIATRLGCKLPLINKRLRENRRSSEAMALEDAALRTCECGAAKWATRAKCTKCLQRQKKREKAEAVRPSMYRRKD